MALMDYLKNTTPVDTDVLAEMENQQNNTAMNGDAPPATVVCRR